MSWEAKLTDWFSFQLSAHFNLYNKAEKWRNFRLRVVCKISKISVIKQVNKGTSTTVRKTCELGVGETSHVK